MSLELINTLGTVTSVVIVAAAAIAALVQLRHLRAGNQINAMLSIGETFNSREFRDAFFLVSRGLPQALADPLFRQYCRSLTLRLEPPDVSAHFEAVRGATVLVGNAYEDLGILVKNGIVDKAIFLDRYCGIIVGAWERLKNYSALTRDVQQDISVWENFEYLTVLSRNWMREHPSTYPKGLPRLELHNPWPVPPSTATA